MALHERLDRIGTSRLPDEVGHIEGEEIAVGRKSVHRRDADVVRIDVVGAVPAALLDCPFGGSALVGGLSPDEDVLAVALVPDDGRRHSLLTGFLEGSELRDALAAEAITGSNGVLLDRFHVALSRHAGRTGSPACVFQGRVGPLLSSPAVDFSLPASGLKQGGEPSNGCPKIALDVLLHVSFYREPAVVIDISQQPDDAREINCAEAREKPVVVREM